MTKLCLVHFSVLEASILNYISSVEIFTKFNIFRCEIFQIKSRINLGFIADKIAKGKLFKKDVIAGNAMDFKV